MEPAAGAGRGKPGRNGSAEQWLVDETGRGITQPAENGFQFRDRANAGDLQSAEPVQNAIEQSMGLMAERVRLQG
ncbi:hypothetical protein D9M71_716710 [compost metagenome]